jgi:hypothetical protein
LSQLHPIFEHLPVENIVFKNQQQYYDAINRSTNAADSVVFIEFMLEKILATLKRRQGEALSKENNVGVNVGVKNISEKILLMISTPPRGFGYYFERSLSLDSFAQKDYF